jgi:glycosyltransferase involved in cell wall biosynthesis
MTIAYQGPLLDYSGYGEANRHFVAALEAAGVDVAGELVAYSKDRADYGTLGPIVTKALQNKSHYKIKVIHTTPDEIERLKTPGKYHIAHFFWETDKIPKVFADGLNLVDEIWTGSEANKAAIIKGGVDKPVYIFPQPIETEREWPAKYELPGFDGFLFYSVFEWTDRKNPEALLRAYYTAFKKTDNVGLLLKTYFRNFNLSNKRMIRAAVAKVQAEFGGAENCPPVFLYLDLMDRQQIMRLHATGDVYVSAHRGEGWGVPQVEAMLAGHMIISTGFGGVHEYLKDEKNAMLIPYKLQPLKGMDHASHFYANDQRWAEIDHTVLGRVMQETYARPAAWRQKIAKAGHKVTVDKFNLERVGGLMAKRLAEIEESL